MIEQRGRAGSPARPSGRAESAALGCDRALPAALSSNGIQVAVSEFFAPMHDSTSERHQPDALRQRFSEDGYVLLRGVLDRNAILKLRGSYFARFDPVMLAPGTTPEEGIFSGTTPQGLAEYGTAGHPAHDFVRTEPFDRFTREPQFRELAETLLGGPVDLVPRRILRHFDRSRQRASRAHVDFDYMDQGSDQVVTIWAPLGDCPVKCGGLVYLEGSHRTDRSLLDRLRAITDRPNDKRPVSNDLAATARALGGRWLWTDYRAGDIVLHSPHLVHASLDNVSDVMRLSADVRFRRRGAAADERWNGDWSADDGF